MSTAVNRLMYPRTFRVRSIAIAVVLFAARAGAQGVVHADSAVAQTRPTARCADCTPLAPMTVHDKAAFYADRTYSVHTLLGVSYAAGIAQWRKAPPEWGTGISGYGRRFAAAYGGGVVSHTTEFSIGVLLHEDPRFEPSLHNGFGARSVDALHNTVYVRTDDGGHRFAWSRAAAALATGFAVNSWEPRRLHSTHHALILSLAGVASYGTGNLTREFTPDIKRFLLRQLRLDNRK